MKSERLPNLPWPKWEWQINRWLFIISCVFGIVPLLVDFPSLPFNWRITLVISLFSIPIVEPGIIWIYKAALVGYGRVLNYQELHKELKHKDEHLSIVNDRLRAVLKEVPAYKFNINRVIYHDEKVHISIAYDEFHQLQEGSRLLVMDTQTELSKGEFEVIQVRPRDYYATAVGRIDPVWLGYIRSKGPGELLPLPYFNAIYIPQRKGEDE